MALVQPVLDEGCDQPAVAAAPQVDARRLVHRRPEVQEMLAVGREHRAVGARIRRQAPDRAALERHDIEMAFEHRVAVALEEDPAGRLIHASHAVGHPCAVCEPAEEPAAGIEEIEMPEAAPLG